MGCPLLTGVQQQKQQKQQEQQWWRRPMSAESSCPWGVEASLFVLG